MIEICALQWLGEKEVISIKSIKKLSTSSPGSSRLSICRHVGSREDPRGEVEKLSKSFNSVAPLKSLYFH